MYEALVILHSWLRWAVLVAGLIAVARAIAGGASGRAWERGDDAAGRWFVVSIDAQVLIGLLLYVFFSPYTMPAWGNMAEAMRNSLVRFMAVEHLVGMLVGTALAHVGRARIRRSSEARRQHRQAAIFYGLALLVILLSIPWPFTPAARPLFRGF